MPKKPLKHADWTLDDAHYAGVMPLLPKIRRKGGRWIVDGGYPHHRLLAERWVQIRNEGSYTHGVSTDKHAV